MAVRITTSSSELLVRKLLRTGWLLPIADQCAGGTSMPTRAVLDMHVLRGEVWAAEDGTAYGMKIDTRVTWFVCAVADVPIKGKDVLDSLIPAGTEFSGLVTNDELRAAIVAVRPDITVVGAVLASTLPTPEIN